MQSGAGGLPARSYLFLGAREEAAAASDCRLTQGIADVWRSGSVLCLSLLFLSLLFLSLAAAAGSNLEAKRHGRLAPKPSTPPRSPVTEIPNNRNLGTGLCGATQTHPFGYGLVSSELARSASNRA